MPEGDRATRAGEIVSLFAALHRLGAAVSVWALAYMLWQFGTIVARAAEIYRTCGFVYYEVHEQLPRCMRGLIESRYWLDMVK